MMKRINLKVVAERILFVHGGRLIFDGALSDLQTRGETLEESFQRLTGGRDRLEPPAPATPSVSAGGAA